MIYTATGTATASGKDAYGNVVTTTASATASSTKNQQDASTKAAETAQNVANTTLTMKINVINVSVETSVQVIDQPCGSIIFYAGTTSPNGWVICDGRSLLASTNSSLYNVIGTRYGGGGGSFNVPDLRNKFLRGALDTGSISNSTVGSDAVTLTVDNIPALSVPPLSIPSIPVSDHTHQYQDAAFVATVGQTGNFQGLGAPNNNISAIYYRQGDDSITTTPFNFDTTGYSGAFTDPSLTGTGITGGSGAPFTTTPVNSPMNYIIKL